MKKRLFLSLLFLAVILYGGLRYIYYGSLTRCCIYTEEELTLPPELKAGILRLRQDTKLTKSEPYYSCLKFMSTVRTIYHSDYTTRMETENLPRGEEFKVVKIMAVTKHGITTMDSGPGPIHYLILENSRGEAISVATVFFGFNRGEELMDFVYQDQTFPLENSNFWDGNHKEFKFSF